jgi:hypothetical protein
MDKTEQLLLHIKSARHTHSKECDQLIKRDLAYVHMLLGQLSSIRNGRRFFEVGLLHGYQLPSCALVQLHILQSFHI